MSKHLPPVPPANRSHLGPGDDKHPPVDTTSNDQQAQKNFDKQGHQGNIKQNTTNQGYQQDR